MSSSSRFGGRTQFDRLIRQQCNQKVTASKSAGVVGKWGSTSFTSIRSGSTAPSPLNPTRPKKFFKSRSSKTAPQPQPQPLTEPEITPIHPPPVKPLAVSQPTTTTTTKRNKFFTSKKAVREEEKEEEKQKIPPLKLRIKTPIPPPVQEKNSQGSDSAKSSESDESGTDSEPDEPIPPKPAPVKKVVSLKNSAPQTYSRSRAQKRKEEKFVTNLPQLQEKEEEEKDEEISRKVRRMNSGDKNGNVDDSATKAETEVKTVVEEVKPQKKKLLDDWSDDDEDEEEEKEDDAEISFKDDSLVIKSPTKSPVKSPQPSPTPNPAASIPQKKQSESQLLLQKSATVASSNPSLEQKPVHVQAESSSTASATAAEQPAPPKKRSIFKSKGGSSGQQKKALYKHKWNQEQDDPDEFKSKVFKQAVFGKSSFDFDGDEADNNQQSAPNASFAASKLVRVTSAPQSGALNETAAEPIVSVKCPKEQKSYYTVIKNVKKAHQIQDSGEFQEFNDDVEYIMEGLKVNNLSTRCLSTVTLASKCMEPSFRMHLRAHGTVTQFFAELKDAPQNASLALCASTVLFVLSQDRLNMDLDRDSLELMLNLLDSDSKIKDALEGSGLNQNELEKNKRKVQELVAAMKAKGHAVNLSLDKISADHLSMETLLSLTSKRAGEWFKEELRELGGLDHLVKTMSDCVGFLSADDIAIWTEPLHEKLKKADRVLKVLENVTHENEENCVYLLKYQDGKFLDIIHTLFKLLDEEVPLNPLINGNGAESVAHTQRDALFNVMRVYINLVHDYHGSSLGSSMAGGKPELFDLALHCLFIMPSHVAQEKRFDILVLALTFLINLVENCVENRNMLMTTAVPDTADSFTAPSDRDKGFEGLIKLFLAKEESARTEETKTDNILDGVKEDEDEAVEEEEKKTEEERIDETVAKLLHKAGRHMEDTLIASYITLIIGYLIVENKDHEAKIRALLPENNFSLMVIVLKKFFNFMNLTASASLTSSRGLKATEMIIKHLEKIDQPPEESKNESFDDLTLFEVTKDDTTLQIDATNNFEATGAEDDFDFGKL